MELSAVHRFVLAAVAAFGLFLTGSLDAVAQGSHQGSGGYSRAKMRSASSAAANHSPARMQAEGQFETKCVVESCGTRWCYKTRVR